MDPSPAPQKASERLVCATLGEYLGIDGASIDPVRIEWLPGTITASTDKLDGYPQIVLKSGQVYGYFSFSDGYTRELHSNGAGTRCTIGNLTGCRFSGMTPIMVDVEPEKEWRFYPENPEPLGFEPDEVPADERPPAGSAVTALALGQETVALWRFELFGELNPGGGFLDGPFRIRDGAFTSFRFFEDSYDVDGWQCGRGEQSYYTPQVGMQLSMSPTYPGVGVGGDRQDPVR